MMTRAYIITLPDNPVSEAGARRCKKSIKDTNSWIIPSEFRATTPETLQADLEMYERTKPYVPAPIWNWPLTGEYYDRELNLLKKSYAALDPRKVIACAVSHWRLWVHSFFYNENMIVLEHDAMFTRRFTRQLWQRNQIGPNYRIIGLNSPAGATRKARVYDTMVKSSIKDPDEGINVPPAPNVNDDFGEQVPSGIAGNSAYFIRPDGAKRLLDAVNKYGLWPNDAIMCSQLLPNTLYQAYPYYTKVESLGSTTTQ